MDLFKIEEDATEEDMTNENDEIKYIVTTTFLNPIIVVAILAVSLIIIIMTYLGNASSADPYGSNYSESSGVGKTISMILGIIAGFVFIFVAGASIAQYIFKVDVATNLSKLFSPAPEIDVTVTKNASSSSSSSVIPTMKFTEEVFNVPGNYYVYDDAKALCSAYGARLATYKEVENSYDKGGEWCNYGWSEGQMALYPTQQKTWDGLQKIKGHENDCGRPGINGGYIKNPAVKFGANCYGYKPKMTPVEQDIMANTTPYPKTKKDLAIEKRVEYWKDRLPEILVSPFNYNSWSKL
jgi:hypothetical protein